MDAKREILKKLIIYLLRTFAQGALIGVAAVAAGSLIGGFPWLSLFNVVVVLVVALGTTVFGLFNFLAYAKPFAEIESFISTIANGDLTRDIRLERLGSLGRFGVPMNEMRRNLHELVSEVTGSSAKVSQSIAAMEQQLESTERYYQSILNHMKSIAAASSTQSQSAGESARAVEEIASGIGRVSVSATSVNGTSKEATQTASTTKEEMSAFRGQMSRVQASFEGLAETIGQLAQRGQEIGGFIQDIKGISEQTNLLALNASIEAARAGEQGKGFSVVASEVRKLATQSSDSAMTISERVGEMDSYSVKAMEAMKRAKDEIEAGTAMLNRTEVSMMGILQSVENINVEMQEISATGEQMAAGSEQVAATVDEMAKTSQASNQSIQEVARLTDSVQELMEASAQASRELSEEGQRLTKLMSRFTL
ncbi:methyl-accepting chemotaxis protein [Paenibacillus turpanensis]|uniref:methyl-accepting chemotaxis protein n=1 Tax=Paenibacillus turpanensis TaxID=2689078 RepID=UPI001408FA1A|nr:methyl-accepting chemotaxis protein [Paenibacillus turpanensis]